MRTFRDLGFTVRTIAGDGPEGAVDVVVPGLAIEATEPPTLAELEAALAGAELVVVENLLTIPLNVPAARALTAVLRGRASLLHHHDPAWQRNRFSTITELPPDDPAWRHVCINELTVGEMAERGIASCCIYNGFETTAAAGDRAALRTELGIGERERLLLHPVRAIARKEVPTAVALADAVGAAYWLPGPAEEGYGPTLETVLAGARTAGVRVLRDPLPADRLADAYAACDAVLYPSSWEGFGLPPIEAAIHRKPVVVGHYPVAAELRALGFRWLEPDDPEALRRALDRPPWEDLEVNHRLAQQHLTLDAQRTKLAALLTEAGWLP